MKYGLGVVFVILEVVGEFFDEVCKVYIRRNGFVKIGSCVVIEVGDLSYFYVIYVVGFIWNFVKVEDCKIFFRFVVEFSILKVAELGMNFVGFLVISFGISLFYLYLVNN